MRKVIVAVVAALALVVPGAVSASPPGVCGDPDCEQGDYYYYGDYSSPGSTEDTDSWSARYGGWYDTYTDDGYQVYGIDATDTYEDAGYVDGEHCKQTNYNPVHVQFGSWYWQRNIFQQAKWCWANGKITMWRAHTSANGRSSHAFCHVTNGPYQYKYGGGVGYWYVDVESYATFGCDYTRQVYDTPWVIVTYMGGDPGCGGCYGWTKGD